MKYPLLSEIAAIRANRRAIDTADDCPHRVRPLYEDIRHAFAGVTLGSGIGLWQAQGLDDYADDDACKRYREQDEKEDWSRIQAAELNRCYSSLSFFDAEGMRFHLPAFLLADLRGKYDHGMVFVLTHKTDYNLGRFSMLSSEQRHAVRSFLTFIAHEPDYALERTEILRALDGYGQSRTIHGSPYNAGMNDPDRVRDYLTALHDRICATLEGIDGQTRFVEDAWTRAEGGGGRTRILREGDVFEQAGVGFSDVSGTQLPPSATATRPELAGASWRAVGVSLVLHPHNPYVPTTHMNVRHFRAQRDGEMVAWWFGGGFDLTPFYPFDEDVLHWHRVARNLCAPFGDDRYAAHKRWCDEYFFLKHRGETRGVGGLFFDDLHEDFERDFAYLRAVGDGFLDAYLPIVECRRDMPWGERERAFQLYRRGRYVEFNLVWDRGTLFGLQSGGRTESILMSLPPLVRWEYGYTPEAGSAEARLQDYLRPRDWLHELG